MEKEVKNLKTILNIFQKYLELNKCSIATFELDAYALKVNSGNKFYCNHKWLNSPIPIDKLIEDFMDDLAFERDINLCLGLFVITLTLIYN